jgi:hypothetical protein
MRDYFVFNNDVFVFKKQQTDEDIDGGISVSSDISSDLEIGSHKDDKPEQQTIGLATCSSEQKQNGGQKLMMQPAEEESELDISGER